MARQLVSFGTEGTVFGGAAGAEPRPAPPAAAPPRALSLEGLRKSGRGGAPHPLAWLELDLPRGEAVTLLGPAGAGKSVVLDLVAGFLVPDAGRVLIGGEKQARVPVWRRDIGLVAGAPDLLPGLSVLGNAAFPLEARGVARPEREARAADMLAQWGIPAERLDARPEALGPAEGVRVALARATVHRPAVLLLDDPLRALEGEAREALAADLRRLHAALGLTILHATRDAALALSLSDRVAVMEGGRVLQTGTPQALYDAPADTAVAALTGPCNRLPGRVVRLEDGLCHVRLDCGVEALGRPVGEGLVPEARCVLAIRPERVAVAPLSPEEMGEEAVPARLLESRFVGGHLRLRLALGEGGEVVAHRPPGLPLPAIGEEASIAWDLAAARIFPG